VVGPGGVWVEGQGKPNGAIRLIDPTTNELISTNFGLDIEAAFVVADQGRVWVAKWVYNRAEPQPPNQRCGCPPPFGQDHVLRLDPSSLPPGN
jgi:hypothetical protein